MKKIALTIALTSGQTITLGASQTWKLGTGATGSGQTLTISSPIAGPASAIRTPPPSNKKKPVTIAVVRAVAASHFIAFLLNLPDRDL